MDLGYGVGDGLYANPSEGTCIDLEYGYEDLIIITRETLPVIVVDVSSLCIQRLKHSGGPSGSDRCGADSPALALKWAWCPPPQRHPSAPKPHLPQSPERPVPYASYL